MIFHPLCLKGSHTLVQIIVEDKTNELLEYKCRFKCEGGMTINWTSEFSSSDGTVMYDSTLSRTAEIIEKTHEVDIKDLVNKIQQNTLEDFKIKVELIIKSTPKVSQNLSSGTLMKRSNTRGRNEFDDECISTNMSSNVIAPTSARSPAFVSCISNLIAASKVDGQPELIELACKLLESAKEFNLPDLMEISTDFLDYQISSINFADILKTAVHQKNDTLLNFTTEYITNNQKELRSTEQWTKMLKCQLLISSIMEKLFVEKEFTDSFF